MTWQSMKQRCLNPRHQAYANYGGRGITICDRWRHSFTTFLADMGPRPEGRTLDRVDNDGNYEPGNCRWATKSTQLSNRRPGLRRESSTRSARRPATLDGVTRSLSQWAKSVGLSYCCVEKRLAKGWSIERALSTPSRNRRH
jgi:hypothetical protein